MRSNSARMFVQTLKPVKRRVGQLAVMSNCAFSALALGTGLYRLCQDVLGHSWGTDRDPYTPLKAGLCPAGSHWQQRTDACFRLRISNDSCRPLPLLSLSTFRVDVPPCLARSRPSQIPVPALYSVPTGRYSVFVALSARPGALLRRIAQHRSKVCRIAASAIPAIPPHPAKAVAVRWLPNTSFPAQHVRS